MEPFILPGLALTILLYLIVCAWVIFAKDREEPPTRNAKRPRRR